LPNPIDNQVKVSKNTGLDKDSLPKSAVESFDFLNPDYEPIYKERAERLQRLREDPSLVPAVKEFYKTHPVEFLTEWFLTFDPRNVERGLPAIVPFILFPKQEEFVDWCVARWYGRQDGIAEKSRDMGVSWLCVGVAVWMWLFHPGTVIGFGSRKEEYVDKLGDPKALFWKVRQSIMLLPAEFRPAGYDEKKHAPHMRVVNPENGSTIIGEAGDNIGRGNRTSIYFVDEAAFLEHAQAVDAALSQTSNCKLHVSTPNGTGNPFHAKRHGGKLPVFTFHWRDDPRKDEAWYRKQKETLDPVIVAQEIDINYSASVGDAFMPGDQITEAQANGPADVEGVGLVKIGVDVARFGDDKSVITARRGRVVMPQKVFQGIDTMDLAREVKKERDALTAAGLKVGQIAVDVIGVGSGVADRLRMLFPADKYGKDFIVDVNSATRVDDGVNYNLRAQMWDNGREWLKAGPVSLPNDPELKTDLTALKYYFKGDLRLIESKDDAKRRGIKSPDRADSLMLTFAFPCAEQKKERVRIPVYQPTNRGLGF
jgi:hypothetical protein